LLQSPTLFAAQAPADFLDRAMQLVDGVIRARLSSRVALVDQISHYII
jgi:hypothetical protein